MSDSANQQLQDFVRVVFDPTDLVEARFIRKGSKTEQLYFAVSDALANLAELERYNREGYSVYFGANPRSRNGGTDDDVLFSRLLFADFDSGHLEAADKDGRVQEVSERVRNLGLPQPSITVYSGHGVHVYWRFDSSTTDLVHWRSLMVRLIALLGSDSAIKDPSRVMRVPGFINHKLGDGAPCVVADIGGETYEWADVVSRLPAIAEAAPAPAASTSPQSSIESGSDNIREALKAMLDIRTVDGKDGSKRVFTLAHRAVEYNLSDGDALRAFRAAEIIQPFPKRWNDAEIIKRIRDAEKNTTRGKLTSAFRSDLQPILTRMSDITPKEIEWLWPMQFGLGKISLVAGDPGLGKSTIAIDMAARVSTGRAWPDGTPCPQGEVIILTAEDGLEDTVRPRLDRQGADCSRVFCLEGALAHSTRKTQSVTLADLDLITEAIKATPNCKLLVVDPVSAYTGKIDSHNNAEVRGLLAGVQQIIDAHNIACVLVTHLNKGSGKAIYRAMGSLAFSAASRAAYMVCKDPNDDDRRLILPTKNNIGNDKTGFAYRFKDNKLEWESDIVYIKADELSANDDPRAAKTSKGPKPEQREAAAEWLGELLFDGHAIESIEIRRQADLAGFKWDTIQRAKESMGTIRVQKCPYTKRWQWRFVDPNALANAGVELNIGPLKESEVKAA